LWRLEQGCEFLVGRLRADAQIGPRDLAPAERLHDRIGGIAFALIARDGGVFSKKMQNFGSPQFSVERGGFELRLKAGLISPAGR